MMDESNRPSSEIATQQYSPQYWMAQPESKGDNAAQIVAW